MPKRVPEQDTINYRLSRLENDRLETARTLTKLAKSQAEMSADIRVLIKEQMRLTQALRGLASFQSEVRHMHSTQQRLFGRIERIEDGHSKLRDEFHVYRAQMDGRRNVVKWMAENWQFMAAIAAVIGYGAWILKGIING